MELYVVRSCQMHYVSWNRLRHPDGEIKTLIHEHLLVKANIGANDQLEWLGTPLADKNGSWKINRDRSKRLLTGEIGAG